jgi:hypothetical protein
MGLGGQYCDFTNINTWHVLNVHSDSPAEKSGLSSLDYIIGIKDIPMTQKSDFMKHVILNNQKPIELLVYNIETDKIRKVLIVPNKEWGGEGLYCFLIQSWLRYWVRFRTFDFYRD